MRQRTKGLLAEAFTRLASRKPFDKITIQDICDESEFNRQTFYYHFKDIYDMLEWMFSTELEKRVYDEDGFTDWQVGVLRVTDWLRENQKVVNNVCVSLDREALENYLFSAIYKLIRHVIDQRPNCKGAAEADLDMIANICKYTVAGFILDWIGKGMSDDPGDFIGDITRIMDGTLDRAIARCKRDE